MVYENLNINDFLSVIIFVKQTSVQMKTFTVEVRLCFKINRLRLIDVLWESSYQMTSYPWQSSLN